MGRVSQRKIQQSEGEADANTGPGQELLPLKICRIKVGVLVPPPTVNRNSPGTFRIKSLKKALEERHKIPFM